MVLVVESSLVEQGTDRDPLSEHKSQATLMFWLCCLYKPLHGSPDVELMCSGRPTIKFRPGFPSVLSRTVIQAGAQWPGFAASGSLLVVFLHRYRTMCLGPEHPFKQSGSWLGSAPKFSLQFTRQGVMPVWAPVQVHRFAVEFGTDLQSAS